MEEITDAAKHRADDCCWLRPHKIRFTLEKAYEERSDGLTWINVDPMLTPLRKHPRLQELVKRMGLATN